MDWIGETESEQAAPAKHKGGGILGCGGDSGNGIIAEAMGDGLQAWELVRLELESFSDCSGENKNRMAGKWEVKDWKNSFFFLGRKTANS